MVKNPTKDINFWQGLIINKWVNNLHEYDDDKNLKSYLNRKEIKDVMYHVMIHMRKSYLLNI